MVLGPLGQTIVTGTAGLARRTGSELFRVAAVVCYAALVAARIVVAVRTSRGSPTGALFKPAAAPAR